jgi:ABC-type uncharacterized transport system auxiliary subunit
VRRVASKRLAPAAVRAISAAAALLCAAALAACSGSFFQSKVPPPTSYLLAPELAPAGAVPAGAARIAVDLAVLKPRVRAGLETDRIAVSYPDRRLDYFADTRWSGPLAEVLQDAAVQTLRERGHLRGVSGDASVFASTYWLEMEVSDFQAEYASAAQPPSVHVRLLGRIGRSADRGIVGRFEVEARQAAAANRLTEIVDAYSRATGSALAQAAAAADRILAAPDAASSR